MRPLIIKFAELAEDDPTIDVCNLEYDKELQLSVLKDSRIPAFDLINLNTQTFTKAKGEETDADPTSTLSLNTLTYSLNNSEGTDSDSDKPKYHSLLATQTATRSQKETTDKD